ncbi:uncharacterized protein LOC120345536 [Styela clava]
MNIFVLGTIVVLAFFAEHTDAGCNYPDITHGYPTYAVRYEECGYTTYQYPLICQPDGTWQKEDAICDGGENAEKIAQRVALIQLFAWQQQNSMQRDNRNLLHRIIHANGGLPAPHPPMSAEDQLHVLLHGLFGQHAYFPPGYPITTSDDTHSYPNYPSSYLQSGTAHLGPAGLGLPVVGQPPKGSTPTHSHQYPTTNTDDNHNHHHPSPYLQSGTAQSGPASLGVPVESSPVVGVPSKGSTSHSHQYPTTNTDDTHNRHSSPFLQSGIAQLGPAGNLALPVDYPVVGAPSKGGTSHSHQHPHTHTPETVAPVVYPANQGDHHHQHQGPMYVHPSKK